MLLECDPGNDHEDKRECCSRTYKCGLGGGDCDRLNWNNINLLNMYICICNIFH